RGRVAGAQGRAVPGGARGGRRLRPRRRGPRRRPGGPDRRRAGRRPPGPDPGRARGAERGRLDRVPGRPRRHRGGARGRAARRAARHRGGRAPGPHRHWRISMTTPGREDARTAYEKLQAEGMKLDLTRGKPSAAQLDLSTPMLSLPGAEDFRAADGTDTRNYGGLMGLPELREIFAPFLQVPVEQLIAAGNSSLELMHDLLVHALLSPLPGGERRWADEERVVFLAPVPGYDRHFGVCERLGIELVPVPMLDDGPDMGVVEQLVAADPTIKGIWCVPKYSNPTGAVYSDETVRRLASMPTAAPDFRIIWDNAYTVHHLTDDEVEIADVLALAAEAANPNRPF